MDVKALRVRLLPFMVFGILFVLIGLALWLCGRAGIGRLTAWLPVPRAVLAVIGALLVVFAAPVFVAAVRTLGNKTAAGLGDQLVNVGIYRYSRNPMYFGLHMSVLGLGLLLNLTGIALVGMLAVLAGMIVAKREESFVYGKYGASYLEYKQRTPFYIPRYGMMLRDRRGGADSGPQQL